MKKKFKLGVIGAGFMSKAIVQGVISANIIDKNDVIVSDVSEIALENAKNLLGVSTTTDNEFLCNNAEFVLFAVKPQSFSSVAQIIKSVNCNKFISIMAGVKKQTIKNVFDNEVFVARAMPNTPCSLKCGAVGVDLTDFSNEDDVNFIKNLFSAIGSVVEVKEELLGTVTGVSGSSPAYFYLFLKGIVEAGVKNGLSYDDALNLATNTMIGAGKMVLSNPDKSLDDLITAVCSKGGTTIEAVNVYNEMGLDGITDKAVDACIKRSRELENL